MTCSATVDSSPVTLITGSDSFLVERAIREVVRATAGTPVVHRLGLRSAGVGELAGMATPTLFGEPTVLIVTEAEAARADIDPEVMDELVALIGDPPTHLQVIICHPGGGSTALLTLARSHGAAEMKCPRLDRRTAPAFVGAEVMRHRRVCAEDVPAALCTALGEDAAALAGAVSLLCSAVPPPAAITTADVLRYHAGREMHGYEVADRLWSGSPTGALLSLRWALSAHVSPLAVLGALTRSLREIIAVAALGAAMPEREVAARTGLHPYRVKILREHCRRWHEADLREAVLLLAQADRRLKGAQPVGEESAGESALTDLQRTVCLEQVVIVIARSRLHARGA